MENFEVSITLPTINDGNYWVDDNCYLAQALKKQFPDKHIKVYSHGFCKIDNVRYRPLENTPFNYNIVKQNLGKNLTIKFEMFNW